MFRIISAVTLVTGTMFLMWLGEQITERGLGNGISLIIFAGIAAGLPHGDRPDARAGAHRRVLDARWSSASRRWSSWSRRSSCSSSAAQRKILVNYAKRQVGNKVYAGPELASCRSSSTWPA